MYSNTCADLSRALVGMQPQLRQMPPSDSRSITATFSPSCEARMAATYPPGPLPTTTKSNCNAIKRTVRKRGKNGGGGYHPGLGRKDSRSPALRVIAARILGCDGWLAV